MRCCVWNVLSWLRQQLAIFVLTGDMPLKLKNLEYNRPKKKWCLYLSAKLLGALTKSEQHTKVASAQSRCVMPTALANSLHFLSVTVPHSLSAQLCMGISLDWSVVLPVLKLVTDDSAFISPQAYFFGLAMGFIYTALRSMIFCYINELVTIYSNSSLDDLLCYFQV